METQEFIRNLLDLTRQRGILFSREQALMCLEHIRLMLEWNQSLNLTRITDFKEILVKHVLDSLIPSRWLPTDGLALDVGTGPGFPGIPLKILCQELEMVLLEAHRKKVSFLKVVLSRLPLQNLRAIQGRWEKFEGLEPHSPAGKFGLVTLRAVRLDAEYLQVLAPRFLKPGGILAWWAGPGTAGGDEDPGPSRKFASQEMIFQGAYNYELPFASNPRRLLVWKKAG